MQRSQAATQQVKNHPPPSEAREYWLGKKAASEKRGLIWAVGKGKGAAGFAKKKKLLTEQT